MYWLVGCPVISENDSPEQVPVEHSLLSLGNSPLSGSVLVRAQEKYGAEGQVLLPEIGRVNPMCAVPERSGLGIAEAGAKGVLV